MKLTDPRILSEQREGPTSSVFPAARRGRIDPASLARLGRESAPEKRAEGLLDYAAFVLEQEAEYCQQ